MTERYDIAAFRARPDGLGGHARRGVSSYCMIPGSGGFRRLRPCANSAAHECPGPRCSGAPEADSLSVGFYVG